MNRRVDHRKRWNATRMLFGVSLAGACSIDRAGLGDDTRGDDGGESTSGSPGSASTSSSAEGESTSLVAGTSSGVLEESTSEEASVDLGGGMTGGLAVLVVGDGTTALDFGAVEIDHTKPLAWSLRNTGSEPATMIAAEALPAPFAFVGGGFPGTGGDCGGTLAPQASCQLAIEFSPTALRTEVATLRIRYAGGEEASSAGAVRGRARTANLLANGDAELGGTPPIGWSNSMSGNSNFQTVADPPPHGGVLSIFANTASNFGSVGLNQFIGVGAHAERIDAGAVHAEFVGFVRSDGIDNYIIMLQFQNAMNVLIGDPPISTLIVDDDQPEWLGVSRDAEIPGTTRSILVQLRCQRDEGMPGGRCDAYFDDLELWLESS